MALLSIANLAALLLLSVVTLAWARHPGRRLFAALTVIALTAAALVYLARVGAADLPVSWLTVLHYGSETMNIAHLYGRGVHAGDNFTLLSEMASGAAPLRLRHVVHLNLGLALLNAIAFFAIAARLQSIGWAIPWTLAFVFNPSLFLAAFSELPSHLLHSYYLAGVVAWAVLVDPQAQPRWSRALAVALLCVLTGLLATTRPEASLPGAVALVVWSVAALLGESFWSRLGGWLWNRVAGPIAFLARHPLLIVLLCAVAWGVLLEGPGSNRTRWALAALYPFNPQFLLALIFPTVIGLPVGVSVALVAGAGFAVLHFRQTGGLVLSLLVLANLYAIAVGLYESVRYMSHLMGLLLLLGLLGRSGFEEWVRRRAWPERWRQVALVLYVVAWCTMPPLSSLEPFLRPHYDGQRGVVEQALLDRNTQREVRFLVEQTEAHPECIFVARALKDHAGSLPEPVWTYIIFGNNVARPIVVPEDKLSLEATIRRYAGEATCVRLYHGDDCNLTYAGGCADFVGGRRPIREWRFWSQPFNDPRERGFAAPEVLLATYDWR